MNTNQQPFVPCERCGVTLRRIGTARVGGKKTHGGWATRTLHKKCWKEEEHERRTLEYNIEVMERLQGEPLAAGWSVGY